MAPLAARQRTADRAFERLYRNHVHAVYRYALAVLHNEADAEDATQTTFLNAYRAFERGERPHTPHNWLIKIAHNVCRQRFRDSSRRPREVELDDSLTPAPPEDSDVPTADEIGRALGALGFNQRAALVMRELEGRSYAEIADVLDVSVSAVETLMFRARRALREQLEGDLTCAEAEQTLSALEQRTLSGAERGALRAHLRECSDCATLERRQRAQRATLDRLGAVPLPASLASFLGGGAGGGAAAGGIGLGAKVAAVLAAGLVVTGVGHEPVTAHATDRTAARPGQTTDRAESPESQAPRPTVRASSRIQRATPQPARQPARSKRSRSPARSGAPTQAPSAPQPATPRPAPAPPSGGASGSAVQQVVGGVTNLVPPPPPIEFPQLPVQLPPPPIQLPPPPIELPPPPIQLPPLPLPPPPPG